MRETDTIIPVDDFRQALLILQQMLERKEKQLKSMTLAKEHLHYCFTLAYAEQVDLQNLVNAVKIKLKSLNEHDKTYN